MADSIAARQPPRAVVVGTAYSGKTSLMGRIHELLIEAGQPVIVLTGSSPLPDSGGVLLVDDAHLLDTTRLAAILERCKDPEESVVLARRPWPRSGELIQITRLLGSAGPPVLLGQSTRADVLRFLDLRGQELADECLADLMAMTGGLTWLLSRALLLHGADQTSCPDGHEELRRTLADEIAHELDTIGEPLRSVVEVICLDPSAVSSVPLPPGAELDDLISQGHTLGLLLRNGEPVPLVRWAVRSLVPIHRLSRLGNSAIDGLVSSASGADLGSQNWASDPRFRTALVHQAHSHLRDDPRRAAELYDHALACGVPATELLVGRSRAAWQLGELDTVAGLVEDALPTDGPETHDAITDTAAAVWAARGMLTTSSAVHHAFPPLSKASTSRATLAHVGVGELERITNGTAKAVAVPSTMGVALELLATGLQKSLAPETSLAALADLVRASDLYTAARATEPISELPAVIAACVAIGVGDLTAASNVLAAAIAGGQGGPWARPRLLLWSAWVSIQAERPADARAALASAEQLPGPRSPRDQLMLQNVQVCLARRYEDVQTLQTVWEAAIEDVRRVDTDIYLLLPLGALLGHAARVGDDTTLAGHFAAGLEILKRLGNPPVWGNRFWWAGVQQCILLNRPNGLAPFARALVKASPGSPVASAMASAGGHWAAVLGGTVDADAVEADARRLAGAGLAWDGARLASHGASRTNDRKVAARLMACARELHTPDPQRPSAPASEAADGAKADGVQLSPREMDVATLVLQGKTYGEIGQAIFISPRTVEHHVASIRRRLDATSRSDLIAKLRLVMGPDPVGRSQSPE
ncbi:MAG: LuxR C-terminal-related transcriptional regulator [Brooklawnia sp.]